MRSVWWVNISVLALCLDMLFSLLITAYIVHNTTTIELLHRVFVGDFCILVANTYHDCDFLFMTSMASDLSKMHSIGNAMEHVWDEKSIHIFLLI